MKTTTLTKEKNRFFQGLDFLSYGLEIFAFIGFELLLTYGIEYKVYGYDIKHYTNGQYILHWVLTCAVWLFGAWYVVRECAKKSGVDLLLEGGVLYDKGIFAESLEIFLQLQLRPVEVIEVSFNFGHNGSVLGYCFELSDSIIIKTNNGVNCK